MKLLIMKFPPASCHFHKYQVPLFLVIAVIFTA